METKSFTYMTLYLIETKETDKVLANSFKSALSYAKVITSARNDTERTIRSIRSICEKVKVYQANYKHTLTTSNMPFIRLAVWYVDFGDDRNCFVAAEALADAYDYIGGEHKNVKTITCSHLALLENKDEIV